MPWVVVDVNPSEEELREFRREFQRRARFLVDESLGPEVAVVIRDLGWKAKYAAEVGLAGHSDEDIFAYAWRKKLIILTHDRDFLDDRRFPFNRNPGVVVLPGGSGNAAGLASAMAEVLSILGRFAPAYEGMKIEITSDGIWTLRNFDKSTGLHRKQRFRYERHAMYEWQD